MLEQFFKSVLEQDEAAVVLCDLNHTIVYMNPAAAKRYVTRGGYKLVGYYEKHGYRNPEPGKLYDFREAFSALVRLLFALLPASIASARSLL